MHFPEFINILNPAINILNIQNEEFKDKFSKELFNFDTASEEELREFESSYIQIPKFYRDFLKSYNPKKFEIMYHRIFGIEEIKNAFKFMEKGELIEENYLPIMSDGGGNYFCIQENDNTLYMADHEDDFKVEAFSEIKSFMTKLVEEKIA